MLNRTTTEPACANDADYANIPMKTGEMVGGLPMRIALVTDAWHPQMNGVVRTLDTVARHIRAQGHELLILSPDNFRSIPCPTYPEIRLGLTRPGTVGQILEEFSPDAVHLATEGTLCLSARRWLLHKGFDFTTAYHTNFPDYFAKRTNLSASLAWPYIRWFHSHSSAVMVSTASVQRDLRQHGLRHFHHWSRGVDLANFTPDAPPPALFADLPRPIQLYVGRVAVEKNIEAFLQTSQPGSKVIVGDGPALEELRTKYPEAHFLGRQSGRTLAGCYAGSDVFVFPSKTDTFGLVIIEALACGTPVAGYPVTGPIDILNSRSGAVDENLDAAIARALGCDSRDCIDLARSYSWEASASQFLSGLTPVSPLHRHAFVEQKQRRRSLRRLSARSAA